ncbi:MAG: mannose-1-phosphate guanylyltransferase/mannose-6-phosphate isomerase [Gammaproteobacteria bacterium]|nr:mannose-1-phosphate guanylyltransferase/mannose-6-phosphate isomerase [Gammaproteobacteria bacterium]
MINILLSGGSGTRLWPLSRTLLPKQFVKMFDNQSLFQKTLLRNQSVVQETLVVSNSEQYFLALDQLQSLNIKSCQFILEPVGRNTAPAIALACLMRDEDDLVLVTTSDHLVQNQPAYQEAIHKAKRLAEEGYLVTFGIKPDYAETGFGYIEAQGNDVRSFKEKPDMATAQAYVDAGNYYWNSGMFCFKAGVFLSELQLYAPEIYQACVSALSEMQQGVMRIPLEKMLAIPEDSIDYAVMEKSDKVKVIPCSMGWSDVGSFDALYDEVKQPLQDNAVVLRGEHALEPLCVDAANNLIIARDRQIALIDVEDLLVVDTSDALLISKKGSSQKVKNVVASIKRQQPALAEVHSLAYRPWGSYEVLVDTAGYKVKRIVVKPGGRLSLQKHYHRNEHWIVVSGTATVTVDDECCLIRPNESKYIKMGQIHRLENDGKIDLVMIEVQVGEYTGEDDIVRIEDVYARA